MPAPPPNTRLRRVVKRSSEATWEDAFAERQEHGTSLEEDSWWFEVREGESMIAYRLNIRRARVVVSEIRLFPATERNSAPGEWEARYYQQEQGLDARDARLIRPGEHMRLLREHYMPALAEAIEIEWKRRPWITLPLDEVRATVSSRPGRAGRPDEFYATCAVLYRMMITQGSEAPATELARALGTSPAHARNLIYQARKRGFLSPPDRPDRIGGKLTAVAKAALPQIFNQPSPEMIEIDL